jgi:hypothetical protein
LQPTTVYGRHNLPSSPHSIFIIPPVAPLGSLSVEIYEDLDALFLFVVQDEVSGVERPVDREVITLCRKVDRFVCTNRIGLGKLFLSPGDRSFECNLEACVDPDPQIEKVRELSFEDEDSFKKDDVDVLELVFMRAELCRGFFGKVYI